MWSAAAHQALAPRASRGRGVSHTPCGRGHLRPAPRLTTWWRRSAWTWRCTATSTPRTTSSGARRVPGVLDTRGSFDLIVSLMRTTYRAGGRVRHRRPAGYNCATCRLAFEAATAAFQGPTAVLRRPPDRRHRTSLLLRAYFGLRTPRSRCPALLHRRMMPSRPAIRPPLPLPPRRLPRRSSPPSPPPPRHPAWRVGRGRFAGCRVVEPGDPTGSWPDGCDRPTAAARPSGLRVRVSDAGGDSFRAVDNRPQAPQGVSQDPPRSKHVVQIRAVNAEGAGKKVTKSFRIKRR